MSFKVYLAGSIPKGDVERNGWKDWKDEYTKTLSTIKNIEFLDPDDWRDETQPLLLFGHVTNLIKNCDLVIINSERKLGVGTSQEMVIAKYFSKPVITVLPKDSHHRKSNVSFNNTKIDDWIHPFIFSMSDLIVEDIAELLIWIKDFQKDPSSKKIKNIKIIDEAIDYYLKNK